MIPTEAFEAWLISYSERPLPRSTAARQFLEVWLAACAWQREQKAQVDAQQVQAT